MSDNKTILLFTDWYEPGFKAGGPIQSCKNIVKMMSDEYDFRIFTSDRDLGDSMPYQGVKRDTWLRLSSNVHVWYASPEFVRASNIRRIIAEINPGVVYLNSMFSSGFSLLPLWVLRSLRFKGRIILAPRGMLNTSAVSRKKWKKKIFLSLFALARISKKIIFHATDKQEQADILKYFRNKPQVFLIENIPNVSENWHARNKQPGQLNCVFVSRIHPIKNLLHAINAVKRLTACSVLFDIYGTIEDEKYFQKCLESISQANAHVSINYKGTVANANIFNVLENYHVFLLPTEGENFGHVIFEALTSGCVVLISDRTPWKELHERNAGWALPLHDKNTFSDKLRGLCDMNEEAFNEKSRAAFQYAREYFATMNFKEKYSSLFQTLDN